MLDKISPAAVSPARLRGRQDHHGVGCRPQNSPAREQRPMFERQPNVVAAMVLNDIRRVDAAAAMGPWKPLSDEEFAMLVEVRRTSKLSTPSKKLCQAETCLEVLAILKKGGALHA